MEEQVHPAVPEKVQEGGSIVSRRTCQNSLVLAELQKRPGQWVPMPQLVEVSGSYNIHSRISNLRDKGWFVENKITYREDGTRMSWYRLRVEEGAP